MEKEGKRDIELKEQRIQGSKVRKCAGRKGKTERRRCINGPKEEDKAEEQEEWRGRTGASEVRGSFLQFASSEPSSVGTCDVHSRLVLSEGMKAGEHVKLTSLQITFCSTEMNNDKMATKK